MKAFINSTTIILEFKTHYYNCDPIKNALNATPFYTNFSQVDDCILRFKWDCKLSETSSYLNTWLADKAYILCSLVRSLENTLFYIAITVPVRSDFLLDLDREATKNIARLSGSILWSFVDVVGSRKTAYSANGKRPKLPEKYYLYCHNPYNEMILTIDKDHLTDSQISEIVTVTDPNIEIIENSDVIKLNVHCEDYPFLHMLNVNLTNYFQGFDEELQEALQQASSLQINTEVYRPTQNMFLPSDHVIPSIPISVNVKRNFYATENSVNAIFTIMCDNIDMDEISAYFSSNISKRYRNKRENDDRPDNIADGIIIEMGRVSNDPAEFLRKWIDINLPGLKEFRDHYPSAYALLSVRCYMDDDNVYYIDKDILEALATFYISVNFEAYNYTLTDYQSCQIAESANNSTVHISTKVCLGPESQFQVFPHSYISPVNQELAWVDMVSSQFKNLKLKPKQSLKNGQYSIRNYVPGDSLLCAIPAGLFVMLKQEGMAFSVGFSWLNGRKTIDNQGYNLLMLAFFSCIVTGAVSPFIFFVGEKIVKFSGMKEPYDIIFGLAGAGVISGIVLFSIVIYDKVVDKDISRHVKNSLKGSYLKPFKKLLLVYYGIIFTLLIIISYLLI